MAVVVGEALVRIRGDADANEIRRDVEPQVSGALEKAGDAGADAFSARMALGIAAAGAAIGAGFLASLDQSRLNDKLAAQLGLTETRSAEVGKVAGSLYAGAWGNSLEEVNTAVGAVLSSIDGMADASSGDLEKMTARALDFATAFDVDVNRSTQIAGQLMRTGLAKDGEEAFDLLVLASQQVPAAVREDVLDAADEYGQFFAGLGYTGPQAFALLVDASEKGMFGIDKLGDAVKEFTIRSTDMSKASSDAYASIGLDAQDMANRILAGGKSAGDATQEVVEGLLGIKDPAEQAEAAIALFGTPLEDLNVAEIPAFLDSLAMANGELENVAGASDRLGETLNDNASTNLTSFTRTLQQGFVDLIGGRVVPIVERLASFLVQNVGPALGLVGGIVADYVVPPLTTLVGWLGENETLVTVLAYAVGTVLVAALAVWGTRSLIEGGKSVVAWVTTAAASTTSAGRQQASALQVVAGWALMGARAVVQGLVIAAVWTAQIVGAAVTGAIAFGIAAAQVVGGWLLMGAQALLAAGRIALAWVIAMGPIALVIAAVVGLVALIVQNFDTIVGAISAAWGWVSQVTSSAWNAVVGFVSGIPGRIVAGLSALGSMIAGVASGAWSWFYDTVVSRALGVVSFVAGLPGMIVGALGNLGGLLVSKGRDLIQGLVDGIAGAASFVGNVAKNIVNAVIGFVNDNVISGINNLLEFTIMGVTINPPDIPRIPRLHSGGVFDSGQGEGLALLRDDELVATPEQRKVADDLLRGLLDGRLDTGPAGRAVAGGQAVTIVENVYAAPGESAASIAARTTQGVVWNLNGGVTRPVGAGAAS